MKPVMTLDQFVKTSEGQSVFNSENCNIVLLKFPVFTRTRDEITCNIMRLVDSKTHEISEEASQFEVEDYEFIDKQAYIFIKPIKPKVFKENLWFNFVIDELVKLRLDFKVYTLQTMSDISDFSEMLPDSAKPGDDFRFLAIVLCGPVRIIYDNDDETLAQLYEELLAL